MKRQVNAWMKDQLQHLLGGKHNFEADGDVNTPAGQSGPNVRRQEEGPLPEPLAVRELERTRPSRAPDPNARPGGRPTQIPRNEKDPTNIAALNAENESAEALAKAGYDVAQNPPAPPGTTRKPDYLIERNYFDCYAPQEPTKAPRGIWSEIDRSKVNPQRKDRQADRIVLNLDTWEGDMDALKTQFNDWPMPNLKEMLVVKDGTAMPFWP